MPHTCAASSQYTGALSRIHVRVSWGLRAQNSPVTRSTSALVGWSARRVMAEKSDTASGIVPGFGRLVPLDSCSHLLPERDPAWPHFLAEIDGFLRPGEPLAAR